jgi:hypothetical protein
MPGQVLHVFQRHILIEKVRYDRHPETVRGEQLRQARIFQPPFHHPPDRVRPVEIARELLSFSISGAKERCGFWIVRSAGCGDIFVEPALKVMADGNLPILAAFFSEAKSPLFARVAVVGQPELDHRADARAGIGENAKHRAIAQADDVGNIHGAKKRSGLLDADFRRLAFRNAVFHAAHGRERIERHGVTLHQRIEEMPEGGQSLVLRGSRAVELADIFARPPRRDIVQARGCGRRTRSETGQLSGHKRGACVHC